MPICLNCNDKFPNRIRIDGKTRIINKRKYCLDCSPFGQKNNQQIHLSPKGDHCTCKICDEPFEYRRGKVGGHKICSRCFRRGKRRELKTKMVAIKGGCCLLCGYNKYLGSLTFHHLDPNQKSFDIAGNHCLGWARIEKELEKCILVCRNCHGEIEAGLWGSDVMVSIAVL